MLSKVSNRLLWRGIILALALVALAGILRMWPLQSLGTRALYTTFYPAVIIAALYGGLSAGLLAMLFSCAQVLFAGPSVFGEPVMNDFADWMGMAVFAVNCTMISGIAETMRRSRSRGISAQLDLERSNAELEAARHTLEDKVKLATAELTESNILLENELIERKAAEDALRKARDELEFRVEERTAALEKAKETVAAERHRFNEVLDMLPAYVVLLSPDYHVPFANRFFEERFGRSHGKRCFEYLFGRTEPCETCETYTVLKTNAPHHWEWIGPDGRNYDIYDFPFIDTDGSSLIMEVGLDVTENKIAQAERENLITELEVKNAELERFIYSVSHDLKSPLITITSFLGFIEEEAIKGNIDTLKADLERISKATRKMGQLLDEVLDLSRIGRKVNPSAAVPMRQLVDEALETLSGRIAERGAKINVGPSLPVLYGDRLRLLEVLQNLIENAVKFMGDQRAPEIEIGSREEDGALVLYVADNGIGIEPCYHDKIFRLFDKLDLKTEGTGIGLTMVKRIVEIHNGKIWVESCGIGKGSRFCFTLPGTIGSDGGGKHT